LKKYTRQEFNYCDKPLENTGNPHDGQNGGSESGAVDLLQSFVDSLTIEQRGRLLALLLKQA
jgi:hypothetical protein